MINEIKKLKLNNNYPKFLTILSYKNLNIKIKIKILVIFIF